MRIISPFNKGLVIGISHAGISKEGQTQINLSIPLDAEKYLQGINLLNCIQKELLPNIPDKIASITQELTDIEVDELYQVLVFPAVGAVGNVGRITAVAWLQSRDNAIAGTLSIDTVNKKIIYT